MACPRLTGVSPPTPTPPAPSGVSPVWLVLGGILSVQVGAAIAKGLFDTVDPTSMVWLRLASSAVVLSALARPVLRGRTKQDWQVAVVFWAPLGRLFHTTPFGLDVVVALGVVGSLVLWVEELRKLGVRWRRR